MEDEDFSAFPDVHQHIRNKKRLLSKQLSDLVSICKDTRLMDENVQSFISNHR